jgi:uncharacterized protein (TIGR00266 family)
MVNLSQGEEIKIENGCMAYHNGEVSLEGAMNSGGGGGLGGFMKAVGRSMVSGESIFITHAKGLTNGAVIALAPSVPGSVYELKIGENQWRVNDSAFFACDGGVSYSVKRQSIGKAIFGGTGGLFVMETNGSGTMLVNSYGDIEKIEMDGSKKYVIDNSHVIAWTTTLDYNIKAASGVFGFTTGEGLVNEFNGRGTVLIQSRNIKSLAEAVARYIPSKG